MPEKPSIELPAPTYWPMVVALGLTLLLAGLITHWLISLAGLLLGIRGGVGWFHDVFPHARHETVPVEVDEAAERPVHTGRKVTHLSQGVGGHRVRYPEQVHPISSGIRGGLLGGVLMAVMAVAYGWIVMGSPWWPVNLLAAIALPSLQTADPETLMQFSSLGLLLAILIHLFTSCFVGTLLAAALPMFPRFAFIWAGLLSPVIWSALFYATVTFINPAMDKYVSWPWFVVCQLGYALVAGYYIKTSQRIETLQTYPIARRAGLEAMRSRKEESDD